VVVVACRSGVLCRACDGFDDRFERGV